MTIDTYLAAYFHQFTEQHPVRWADEQDRWLGVD